MNAVIFDMDGVVVDSVARKHSRRTAVLREEFGVTDVRTDELVGLNTDDKYEYLVEHAGLTASKSEFRRAFDRGIERVYREDVTLMDGLAATLAWLDDRSVPTGLASASDRERVALVVERFDLDEWLDATVSADDVTESKPDPAIYHRAASLLGVDPASCVAVEDSTHGVRAAVEAGMRCFGYDPAHHPDQDLGAAEEVFESPTALQSRLRSLVE